MAFSKITPDRRKRIKRLLSMMNKQNQRFIPIAPPLIEMMDMVTSDQEINYLLQMGTELYDYQKALQSSNMAEEDFQPFFEEMKRKGLVYIEYDESDRESYRLNAILVGWYEYMMHYLVGKPEEKAFSEKFDEFFKYFQKFNFFPLRDVQNLIMPALLKPTQDTAIMNPEITSDSKRKTIPIAATVSIPESKVYPTFYVNELIEEDVDEKAIYAFPCVCRHGNSLIGSGCNFDMPKESCIVFGPEAKAWAKWGYGRYISKEEAIDILKEVRDKGAVHSVLHERDDHHLPAIAICNCCWDCCGILKPYNSGLASSMYKASYTARIKEYADCKGCGNCEKFCPTAAIKLKDKKAILKDDICIGCGQCAFQCRQNNIELYANERMVFLPILKKSEARVTS